MHPVFILVLYNKRRSMNPYVVLAKSAVESCIKNKKIIIPSKDLPEDLFRSKAGVFVTIKERGQLRGCMGTYLPTKENIAKEIVINAIAAATEDYRFSPIQKDDLPRLSYEVYILSKPELVKDPKDLNPKKYGIIVKTPVSAKKTSVVFNDHLPSKTGLLLPHLEGINTIEQQISIACQKGDINPEGENILIYKFTVKKYE